MNDTNVPDCVNPDAASWLQRDVVSLSGALSGAGVVDDGDFDMWDEWFESTESRNVKVSLGAREWTGAAKLAALNVTGSRGSRTLFDASIVTDGILVRTP